MKHLIVVAHPREQSFTMAVARTYASALERLGHVTHLCDLYRLDFDPVLQADELTDPGGTHAAPLDVRREQAHVHTAEAVAFVYPLWWGSMPAIMKGYIDRVFSYGFAYDYEGDGLRGLLTGRKAVVATISAAPLKAMVTTGDWDAIEALQDRHIFRNCGMELVEHLHCGQIVPGLSAAAAERHFARVRACAARHFGSTGS